MSDAALILVVEDDRGLRDVIREDLRASGYAVAEAGDAESAARWLTGRSPDLIISDVRSPGDTGLDLLYKSRRLPVPPAFLALTAFGNLGYAVRALQQGADNFLTKPLDLDHLRLSVRGILERRSLQAESTLAPGAGDFHELIGRSAPMRQLFEQSRRMARANGPVLITGESGVGKELVARALHAESERQDGPFLAVNCAGIPPDLLETELFGHSAGAFTGAQRARKGLFAEADGGTLLLDEIGEMPAVMQSKLLRVLQDGCMRPVGDDRERRVDVRIVAATNRDPEVDIEAGSFRADLFYRLETFALEVPPLRRRGDDIDLLAVHFVARFGAAAKPRVRGIAPEALACLRAYPFPGNVRELSNAIERAVVFARRGEIGVDDLPRRIQRHRTCAPAIGGLVADVPLGDEEVAPLREVELRYVRRVLDKVDGNKRRAAELLGIGRRTLYRYLEEE